VAADATLEYRFYYCQNWRGDVVALINSDGAQVEHARYTSYGVPIGMPGADTDSDGDCDSTDITQIQTWIDAPSYDVRGDVDLDGDVDATDKSTAQGWLLGKVHGWEVMSTEGNRESGSGRFLLDGLRVVSSQTLIVIDIGFYLQRHPIVTRTRSLHYRVGPLVGQASLLNSARPSQRQDSDKPNRSPSPTGYYPNLGQRWCGDVSVPISTTKSAACPGVNNCACPAAEAAKNEARAAWYDACKLTCQGKLTIDNTPCWPKTHPSLDDECTDYSTVVPVPMGTPGSTPSGGALHGPENEELWILIILESVYRATYNGDCKCERINTHV